MTSPTEDLVEIRILQLPVEVWARAREHAEALQREFALIDTGRETAASGMHEVPQRLLDVIAAVRAQYAGVGTPQEEQMYDAEASGKPVLDELVYQVPPAMAEAVRALEKVFDEADEYCRAGQHLLTLETPAESLAYRRWFLGEFARQIAGEPPMSWPHYLAAHPID